MYALAEYLTRCLISNSIVGKEQEEEYVYGFQILIGKLLSYITLILLSLYYGVLVPGLIFMGVFFSLRGRTGGYHAKTSLRCYLVTVASYLLVVQIGASALVEREYISIIISIMQTDYYIGLHKIHSLQGVLHDFPALLSCHPSLRE